MTKQEWRNISGMLKSGLVSYSLTSRIEVFIQNELKCLPWFNFVLGFNNHGLFVLAGTHQYPTVPMREALKPGESETQTIKSQESRLQLALNEGVKGDCQLAKFKWAEGQSSGKSIYMCNE
jgi:hypothetical protein